MSQAGQAGGVAIGATSLTKTYRMDSGVSVKALDGVTVEIEPSSMVALTGPSGSGKSTFLQVVGGLTSPDAGRLTVGGQTITGLARRELTEYRRRVGFVFQRFNLLPALTALDNVIAPVVPRRVPYDKTARGLELLAAVGLADKARQLPARLSGGEQQRVAIARALIGEPGLILADEPTGNLDSATGGGIIDLLHSLRDRSGVTIIIGTHDPDTARRCERRLHLQDGKLTQHGRQPDNS